MISTLLAVLLLLPFYARGQSAQAEIFSTATIQPDLMCSPAPCRLPNVRVTQGNKIDITAPNLAINPQNSSQMILGVEDASCNSDGASYSTNDVGSTWTKTCLPFVGTIDLISNAWMVYDNNGEVHALLGTFNEDCGENLILETHSFDNGGTWSSLN